MKKDKELSFLESHKNTLEVFGFWDEVHKSTLIHMLELRYATDVLKEWSISDIVINGDKVIFKWHKRYTPLNDESLKEKYGR